jgi:DNA-binding CsgD family transcriptional regulator
VRDIVTPVHAEAERLQDASHLQELAYWLAVAARPSSAAGDTPRTEVSSGTEVGPGTGERPGTGEGHGTDGGSGGGGRPGGEHPYAVQAAGRWREAAAAWAAAGCPYEQAAALAESPDPADLLAALGLLDDLGARPLATRVRGRLRALGITHIPRGPVGGTRANPAGLTARQIDVLRLLVQGHSNAQIARELVVSVRTVDSHVAAVLGKLGARDRHDAAARAAELGILGS